MGRASKSANPVDEVRRKQHQRELKKNKSERSKARQDALLYKDTSKLETEIQRYADLERHGRLDKNQKQKLSDLEAHLKSIRDAQQTHGTGSPSSHQDGHQLRAVGYIPGYLKDPLASANNDAAGQDFASDSDSNAAGSDDETPAIEIENLKDEQAESRPSRGKPRPPVASSATPKIASNPTVLSSAPVASDYQKDLKTLVPQSVLKRRRLERKTQSTTAVSHPTMSETELNAIQTAPVTIRSRASNFLQNTEASTSALASPAVGTDTSTVGTPVQLAANRSPATATGQLPFSVKGSTVMKTTTTTTTTAMPTLAAGGKPSWLAELQRRQPNAPDWKKAKPNPPPSSTPPPPPPPPASAPSPPPPPPAAEQNESSPAHPPAKPTTNIADEYASFMAEIQDLID
ncbi:hypothetical protein H4R33_003055 [Dimargaris cristalligena]|nr:hypothetical protein H4R33_003055 [Dimargaris cristalligena]